jgi:hypothetical protein
MTSSHFAGITRCYMASTKNVPGKRSRLPLAHPMSCAPATTSIVWYRDFDLRIRDHQPLTQAAQLGCVVPVFVWPSKRGSLALGGAAQVPPKHMYLI